MRRGFEIVIDLPEGDEVCDFCSESPIYKGYDCDDFPTGQLQAEAVQESGPLVVTIHSMSKGAWAACKSCADLIDDNQWPELTERSLEILLVKEPAWKVFRSELRSMLAEMHQEFRTRKKLTN